MKGTGFYQQKPFSPAGLAVVLALHAAALAAVVTMKGPVFVRETKGPLDLIDIYTPPPPPERTPPPARRIEQPAPPVSRIETADTIIDVPIDRPPVAGPPAPPPPIPGTVGTGSAGTAGTARIVAPPMRIEAEFDPRFAGAIQPAYPTSEQRAQRDGRVRLRVTIGTDGRVKAVERIEATSDAFWRATERHALARWRFRPATIDGQPVESSKVLNVHFRIEA